MSVSGAGARVVVLGTGTEVGKTYASVALLAAFARRGPAVGLKPVETGVTDAFTDQLLLSRASSRHLPTPEHALYSYEPGVSPHLAAEKAGRAIDFAEIAAWVKSFEGAHAGTASVIETAGGAFSPLSSISDNLDLARQLSPSRWVLVASNELGVLHQVRSTVEAMASRGRAPDVVVLCQPRAPDHSASSNLAELQRFIYVPCIALGRGDDAGDAVVRQLAAR